MKTDWLVTPYFLDAHDADLRRAVPEGVAFLKNDPGGIADRSADSLARLHRPVADFALAAISRGKVPVSVAGDCCASLPVMAGAQRAGLSPLLVWLDAHGDFNTPETSPSGFLGGMPLAMMVGRGALDIPRASGLAAVAETDVRLIGARDLDPLEAAALESSEVRRAPLGALAAMRFDRPVHLHVDNDIIDAAEAPANNYPVAGGPSLNEVIEACTDFAAGNTICAVSFSGWNGRLDGDGRTGAACRSLLGAIASAIEA